MNKNSTSNTQKTFITKAVKYFLEKELTSLGSGTGSFIYYQQKAPVEFDR